MSDDFTPRSHNKILFNLQHQDSFHVKKLKFHFEIHRQIFTPNVVQIIIWLKTNDVWQFHAEISQWKFCQITTSRLISRENLKFLFEIFSQIFAPNVVQTIIWLKINDVWRFHAKISPWKFCQITTSKPISREKIKI